MTFEDDFARLNWSIGVFDVPLVKLELEWPPPDLIFVGDEIRAATPDDDPGLVMRRVSMSAITDEQRSGMTHVCRGAEYRYRNEDDREPMT